MYLKIESNVVNIKNQNADLGVIVNQLSQLSGTQLAECLASNKTMIPRKVRMQALKEILEIKLHSQTKLALSDDEKHKLFFFDTFSEYQLEKLFDKLYNSEMLISYKKNYMKLMLKSFEERKIDDEIVNQILNLIPRPEDESFMEYNEAMFNVTYDKVGEIDGLSINECSALLLQSATALDMKNLGKKYGVSVPRRLKKDDMLNIISANLQKRGEYSDELFEEIRNLSVTAILDFAKSKDLNVSFDLKKEEIASYLVEHIISSPKYICLDDEIIEEVKELEEIVDDKITIDSTFDEEENVGKLFKEDINNAKRLLKLEESKQLEEEMILEDKNKKKALEEKLFIKKLNETKKSNLRFIKYGVFIIVSLILLCFILVMVDSFVSHKNNLLADFVEGLNQYFEPFVNLGKKSASLIEKLMQNIRNKLM